MNKLYWVGNKLSDIIDCKNVFYGSINLYGESDTKNVCFKEYRCNNNASNPQVNEFIETELLKLIQQNNVKFMFYNPKKAFNLSPKIREKTICLNDLFLLEALNDKISCHDILKKYADFPPYFSVIGNVIRYKDVKRIFPNSKRFVVQNSKSSGGFETFILTDSNEKELIKEINPTRRYLVSTYIENNISYNYHIIIGDYDYIIFPPSMQLLAYDHQRISYIGADFINCQKNCFIETEQILKKIILILRKYGYRGIIGADFIKDQFTNKVFLVELNCRFQGSSFLINKSLKDLNLPSLQEINIMSFNHLELSKIIPSDFKVNYSSIIHYQNKSSNLCIENARLYDQETDGLDTYKQINESAYLYKDIFVPVIYDY